MAWCRDSLEFQPSGPGVGIGRRRRLKSACPERGVWVRVPPRAHAAGSESPARRRGAKVRHDLTYEDLLRFAIHEHTIYASRSHPSHPSIGRIPLRNTCVVPPAACASPSVVHAQASNHTAEVTLIWRLGPKSLAAPSIHLSHRRPYAGDPGLRERERISFLGGCSGAVISSTLEAMVDDLTDAGRGVVRNIDTVNIL